jgi:8-oxo-dGTP diphosphatase
MLEVLSMYGQRKLVPRESVRFRPMVHGIITHENQLLVIRTRILGKLDLPGGGIEIGEKMTDALQREVKEEAGITVEVGRFFHTVEDFRYDDRTADAYHLFLFYFRCTPNSLEVFSDEEIQESEVDKLEWLPLDDIQASDFLLHQAAIRRLLEERHGG